MLNFGDPRVGLPTLAGILGIAVGGSVNVLGAILAGAAFSAVTYLVVSAIERKHTTA